MQGVDDGELELPLPQGTVLKESLQPLPRSPCVWLLWETKHLVSCHMGANLFARNVATTNSESAL